MVPLEKIYPYCPKRKKKYHTFVLLVLVLLLFAKGAFILKKISLKRYCALNNVKESQTFYRKLISEINLERKILPCPSNNMSGTSFTYKDDHLKWTGVYALEYHFTQHIFFPLLYLEKWQGVNLAKITVKAWKLFPQSVHHQHQP